jgi:PQQ-like domain
MAKRSVALISALIAVGLVIVLYSVTSSIFTMTPLRSPISASTDSVTAPPGCSMPCAVWTKAGGSQPTYVAISPNDSFIAVAADAALGNNSVIYALDENGHMLWSHNVDHQIHSLVISSNGRYIAAGGLQVAPGPRGALENGEVYLFDAGGKELWTVDAGTDNPIGEVAISSNGSIIAAAGESDIMYMNGATHSILWSRAKGGGGNAAIAMSANGSLVVATFPSSVVAYNAQGTVLWSSPPLAGIGGNGTTDNNAAISSDGSHVWVGEAVSGDNGNFSLFTAKGQLQWQRQINSPALSIQTGDNLTAFVSTNQGALLYGGDGSLLANVTGTGPSATTGGGGGCDSPPSFWWWSGDQSPVIFFDSRGNAISSYDPGGFTVAAAISPDHDYAVVASDNISSVSSLALVYLGQQPSQSCTDD